MVFVVKEAKMYINGQWVDALSGETFDDFCPYTGELYAKVAKGGVADVDRVMAAAYDARKVWANTLPLTRSQIMSKAATLMWEKKDEFIDLLIHESGSAVGKAEWEVFQTANVLQFAAEDAKRIYGETYHNEPWKVSMTWRKPRGTVVAISPWNFPMVLAMYKIAYGLATGNTVVLKPASETPLVCLKFAEIFEEAGLPAGAFNIITGPGSVLGDALIDDKRTSFVAITGETVTGRKVAQRCAAQLKQYTLELGGKNPMIVLKDANIDYAVKLAAFSAYLHQGEICMSVDKVIVEREIVKEFTEKFVGLVSHLPVGDPADPGTFIGPVISDRQAQSIDAHVKDAVAKGATLLTGGTYEGRLYQPTVLTDITPDMKIYAEETFGPVTSIYAVDSIDEALRIANDSEYGLSSAVVTKNLENALYVAENLEAGMVHVNDSSVDANEAAPFGGVKGSGIGREGGQYSINEYTEVKWVTILKQDKQLPF